MKPRGAFEQVDIVGGKGRCEVGKKGEGGKKFGVTWKWK
jgi:hypothetical protein